jgi:chorismate mutase
LNVNESVDALRKKIDQVDEKIVELLNKRASLAQVAPKTGRASRSTSPAGKSRFSRESPG